MDSQGGQYLLVLRRKQSQFYLIEVDGHSEFLSHCMNSGVGKGGNSGEELLTTVIKCAHLKLVVAAYILDCQKHGPPHCQKFKTL